jgi:LytS/YehU family sensor histidine kinase
VLCKFFRDLQRSQQQFRELSERNMQLELNLIKSQVNPHFLLNTLNNIYGISIGGSREQIGEMILNLSGFLKYSLYECNHEYVEVSKEIKLIKSYIELEEVRSDFIDVRFDVKTDVEKYFIPPFILFPLVENAFKHGTKNLVKATTISMELTIENGQLNFRIENDVQAGKAESGGFGLPALKKKIEYYYPENSTFNSSIENGRYIAQLQITGLCQNLPA